MQNSGASRPDLGIIRDRGLFLRALQNCAPEFWQSFQKSALQGDCLSAEEWATCVHVVDDWFIQVLRDTLARWKAHPEHGGSQLHEGYDWFVYGESIPIEPFAPTFDRPFLLFNGPTPRPESSTDIGRQDRDEIARLQRAETPDEFGVRMSQQFTKQLTEYKKYIRHVSPAADNRTQRPDHAEWTALVFSSRATVAEIAENWPGLGRNKDAYATVSKAVKRFAADIDLTIEDWTRT
jgi:hypothetical protein